MVLESTMICFDNSDYQRNGDYFSTRLNVQKDGVHLVCLTKVRSNPENNVGLMTMANSTEVLATLTSDVGRIFSKLHAVQPNGEINLLTGIRIAHLVLKHRQGKNHKMRIVAFVGSPLKHDETEMIKLAKRLKKEKVNVDLVSFGEHANNNEVLSAFINALNGKDGSGSHLVSVPRGSDLSDALLSSPIIQGEDGMGGAGLGGSHFEFGVDPNEDPELALALRVSMEEQRQRQEDEQRRAMADSNTGVAAADDGTPAPTVSDKNTSRPTGTTPTTAVTGKEKPATETPDISTEEAMLQRALALSTETVTLQSALPDFSKMTEEEQIAFAMQMSMQDAADDPVTQQAKRPKTDADTQNMDVDEDYSEVVTDTAFLQNVLENLPGVDPNNATQSDTDKKAKDNKTSESGKK